MPDEIMPWERQGNESSQAFAGFCSYRDLGSGRSIEKAAKHVRKSVSLLKRWSSRYYWVERIEAWDREQDRLATQASAHAARERAEEIRHRQVKDGQDLQRLARAGIAQLIQRDPVTSEPRLKRELKVGEIVILHRYGAELERTAAPAVTDQGTGPDAEESGDLDQMLRELPQEDIASLLKAARAVSSSAQRTESGKRSRRKKKKRGDGKQGHAS
jgi:hypothetical protein